MKEKEMGVYIMYNIMQKKRMQQLSAYYEYLVFELMILSSAAASRIEAYHLVQILAGLPDDRHPTRQRHVSHIRRVA